MEIPIRFKFFDKLKLYQDYLKHDCMLEKTKSEYWLYEKSILFWAYSSDHQHLGRPLDANVFCIDIERVTELPNIAKKLTNNINAINWVKENIKNKPAAIHTIANLNTLGFTELVSKYKKEDGINPDFIDFPNKMYINPKGFLLGELLYETFECPKVFYRNFRIYKCGILLLYIIFVLLILTTILLFVNNLVSLVGKNELFNNFNWLVSYIFSVWWITLLVVVAIFLIVRNIWNNL